MSSFGVDILVSSDDNFVPSSEDDVLSSFDDVLMSSLEVPGEAGPLGEPAGPLPGASFVFPSFVVTTGEQDRVALSKVEKAMTIA